MSNLIPIEKETLDRMADGFRESRGITNQLSTEDMIAMAKEKVGSGENKLAKLIDGSIEGEITEKDLEGATTIKNYAFQNCEGITSVIIPDSVKIIGQYSFNMCQKLANITIGNGVTKIDSNAFSYCRFTNITIPDNVTSIGTYAFVWCDLIANIIIGNGVTKIGDYAFQHTNSLVSVTVGSGITSIGKNVFYKSSTSFPPITITLLGTTPPTISTNTFNVSYLNKIIVPKGCGEAYKTATNWANFADYIEEASE